MRLIELSANRESFKPVRFNRHGLTIVVGKHRTATKANLKETYNGVGKSLIIALVHYCLGSNKNDQFDVHLRGWEFTLAFEHAGITYRVSREPTRSKLLLNGSEISLSAYRDFLKDLGVFKFPSKVPYLTFNSLIAFFLRPNNASYVRYDRPRTEWTEYQSVLSQSFLLGIDYVRAQKKHDNKKRLDEQESFAKRYRADKELREFYLGERNAEVELLDLTAIATKLN